MERETSLGRNRPLRIAPAPDVQSGIASVGTALVRGAPAPRPASAQAGGALLAGFVCLACSPPEVQGNRTFYADSAASELQRFERPVPRLHAAQTESLPAFVGVEVLGAIELSRPAEWRLASASQQAGGRYVRYLSPNAYSFAIYDQPHWSRLSWAELLPIFEKKVEAAGSRVAGGAVPVAVHRGQGFAYDIRFEVPAAEAPLLSRSREWLLRADERLVLVQVVRQSATFAKIDEELLQVLSTLRVR